MKHYFSTLNDREKWMLVVGGLCLILYLYYLFAYAPLSKQTDEKRNQLVEKIETLEWMKQVQQQAHSSPIKKSLDHSQMMTLIASQLKENPLLKFPYQLQQINSGDIQLSFDKVPFKLFLLWLEKMSKEYSIKIKQLDVDPTKVPGVTRLVLIMTVV